MFKFHVCRYDCPTSRELYYCDVLLLLTLILFFCHSLARDGTKGAAWFGHTFSSGFTKKVCPKVSGRRYHSVAESLCSLHPSSFWRQLVIGASLVPFSVRFPASPTVLDCTILADCANHPTKIYSRLRVTSCRLFLQDWTPVVPYTPLVPPLGFRLSQILFRP